MKSIILKKGKEESLLRKHPWVYSGAVQDTEGDPLEGELVEVKSCSGKYLGTGFYFPSSLQIKMLCFEEKRDETTWHKKISSAWNYRVRWGLPSSETNAFRCFFGEADGIPGLIADYYHGLLILHFHHAGLLPFTNEILQAFLKGTSHEIKGIWLQSESKKEMVYSSGSHKISVPWEIMENNLRFMVDWESGQKTGFFLDQRDNRKKIREISSGKKILDLFCYTGGFTINALKGGAEKVVSVDSSSRALDMLKEHVKINQLKEPQIVCSDVFDFLKTHHEEYDIVICDPPAFAKSLKNRHQAIMAYKRLNLMVMNKVRPGGMLMTYSCSGVVTRELFYHTITSACMESENTWYILENLYPGPDHPVSPLFPEGDYLKGLGLVKKC